MNIEDIQIIKSYPPWAEALRLRYLEIMDSMKHEAETDIAAIPPMRDGDRTKEIIRIERRFREQMQPLIGELALLENHASITVSIAA